MVIKYRVAACGWYLVSRLMMSVARPISCAGISRLLASQTNCLSNQHESALHLKFMMDVVDRYRNMNGENMDAALRPCGSLKTMHLVQRNTHIYLAVIAASLVAIWPLPETIALRHLLLVIGLALSFPVIRTHGHSLLKKDAWPLWVLASFFLWLLVHLAFFSVNVDEQWQELSGDWVRSLLAAVIGLSLGLVLARPSHRDGSQSNSKTLELILFAGFSGTVVIFFFRYIYEIFITSQWVHKDFYMTPFKSKTPLVVFGGIFLPLAFIKILRVFTGDEKPRWTAVAFLGILLTLFAEYFANTKNGFVVLAFVSAIFVFDLIRSTGKSQGKHIFIWPFLLALLIITAFGVKKHLESNEAWRMLWPDIKVGFDIDHHEYWKNRDVHPLPTNEYGVAVNGSTYERIAWATAAIQLIKENPQGFGLIHHSFGALAIEKWPDFYKPIGKMRGATHSGWIDFTLGLGIPGLLLVLVPLGASFWRALHREGFWYTYIAWTVPVITLTYTITEVSSDHFIELLFFMAAVFCGMTLKPYDNASQGSGTGQDPQLARV